MGKTIEQQILAQFPKVRASVLRQGGSMEIVWIRMSRQWKRPVSAIKDIVANKPYLGKPGMAQPRRGIDTMTYQKRRNDTSGW